MPERVLVRGPAAAGKTKRLLDELRVRLRAGRADFRYLVPTATMAEHVRHELAREGLLVRPQAILTLSRFLLELGVRATATREDVAQFLALHLEKWQPVPFEEVASTRGFQELLAELFTELSNNGCGSARWGGLLDAADVKSRAARALVDLYAATEAWLAQNNLLLRGAALAELAEKVRGAGLRGIDWIGIDGFFTFSAAELPLLSAFAQHADVTITLPDALVAVSAQRGLHAAGFREETVSAGREAARVQRFSAPTTELEAEEIARRILEEERRGRPFREMGVVLRAEEPLAPALRLAFHRFGIPARFYFARSLAETAGARILEALAESALSGWTHEGLLRAVQAGLLGGAEADAAAWELRERIPAAGLNRLPTALASLREHEAWAAAHKPADWPALLLAAIPRDHFVPTSPGERLEAAETRDGRKQLERTLQAAARAFSTLRGDDPVALESFWPAAQDALAAAQFRAADGRRNAVAVMDVYEARQWRLPVIFIGALLEGEFPRRHQPDPLLGDLLRRKLAKLGVPLRTSEDRQEEEDFLFEFAATRAAERLVLSYPRFDPKGKATLPSFLLEAYRETEEEASRTIRPVPRQSRVLAVSRERLEDEVRERLTERFPEWHPTALEAFLQCPFLFFARHGLAVEERPVPPQERFDARLRGTIVHHTMAAWHQDPGQAILSVFEREFARACRKQRVVPGFETLRWRITMRRGLERFAAQFKAEAGWRIETEKEIRFDLARDIQIAGRADRVDHGPGGEVFVVDYKFSGAQKLGALAKDANNGRAVQAGIYLAGLTAGGKATPAGFAYVSLREPEKPREWREQAEVASLIQVARASAQRAVEGVRDGEVAPEPADPDKCKTCEWRDACRVGSAQKAAVMGGDEE